MGNRLYSADLMQLVAQANRAMAAERTRQLGDKATEEGRIALQFAEKELGRIYGFNSGVEKLSLSGVTDEAKIEKIREAAERITGSKLLTAKGRREVEQQRMETFFGVNRGNITSRERKIWKALTEKGGIFDQLHEMTGMESPSKNVQKAIEAMQRNGKSGLEIVTTLELWARENKGKKKTEQQSIYDYVSARYPDFDWREPLGDIDEDEES